MAKAPAPKAAEAKEPDAESVALLEAKKASKKRLIILVAAVVGGLVLGGGGVGAYFTILHKDNGAEKPVAPEKVAEEDPEHPAEGPFLAFVNLPHLSAPIIDNGNVIGYALLDFALEVHSDEDQKDVFQHLPTIRAAFLIDVTEHPIGTPEDPTVIDYAALSVRLLDVANREFKEGAVKRVLVTQTTR